MNDGALKFGSAKETDLPHLIALLKDAAIAANRETKAGDECSAYTDAFQAITEDPNNDLIVAKQKGWWPVSCR